MSNEALAYLIVEGGIWIIGIAITLSIAVPLLRWIFRINEQIEMQREILMHLRHINANTEEQKGSLNPPTQSELTQ